MRQGRAIRGAILRLTRRRGLAIALGVALAAPAAWIELASRDEMWWVDGLTLVAGATGVALIWVGISGPRADWVE